MAQSVQRGDEWWNQRPDGVWVKWSNDAQAWFPQPGGPPPAIESDTPFSSAPAESGFASSASIPKPISAPTPTQSKPAPAPPQSSSSSAPAPPKPQPVQPAVPADSTPEPLPEITPAAKANSPIFSEARRELPAIRESKILLGIIASILIVGAFVSTYSIANMFFSRQASAANAQELKTPKGFSKQKWAYILKKDKLCRESNVMEFNADLGERMASVENQDDLLAMIDEAKAKFTEMVKGFQAGPMPKQDRPLLQKIFVLQNGVGPFFDRLSAAIEKQDLAAIQSLTTETLSKGRQESELMSRYGFQICGRMPV